MIENSVDYNLVRVAVIRVYAFRFFVNSDKRFSALESGEILFEYSFEPIYQHLH